MGNFWVNLVPDRFPSFIGTISLIVALICMFLTFNEKKRSHATKLFAIMVVVSLAFFSSHWATYFAAIFIVATAVTELDFLQNLAAIISKDKNYFDYRKEVLSKDQNIKRKAEEVVEEEFKSSLKKNRAIKDGHNLSVKVSEINDLPRSTIMRMAYDIEDKVLEILSRQYQGLERGVRLSGNNTSIEVDGLIFDSNGPREVFEIKWAKTSRHVRMLVVNQIRRLEDIQERFKTITGSTPEYTLVLVVNDKDDIQEEKWSSTLLRAKEANMNVRFMSLDELGYNVSK
ncbi:MULTISPECIES: hypothetical protein [unclassified Vibrio]|uniref:hypothetical protein n=1 Tax=unclassified Vibrio TaxID=2614977 RepID=UPI0035530803